MEFIHVEVAEPVHPSTSLVDLDAGVTLFATLSDGTMFDPVNTFRKNAAKLAKYQRCLSRKTKCRPQRGHQYSKGRTCPARLPSERCSNVVSNRNSPKRLMSGSMPRLSAVGISSIHAGEDVCGTVI